MSVQFSSVTQSCPTLCDPMDCSTLGFPVHHQLPEFTQTHIPPTSSSFVVPFSSRLQSFPASGSFQMSQVFASGGQKIGVVASASVLPMGIQDRFLWDGWVGSPCSPRDSQESSPTPQFKSNILQCSAFFTVQLSHPYMTTGKTIALTRRTFVGKVMSLLLNMLSRLVIIFLPRCKCLLISWLQS